ncbi:MAG: Lrp/AsnC family transcriptional regulator [Promethearchaeota archaeon]|nr:MAG: Lrp/AsnC family transcriptional regulator [Candidatus Lokiarchaeota archaeon]
MENLDDLDLKIISILREDSRIKFTEIAKILNVPDTTVHFRIKKLKGTNTIKNFTILIEPDRFGYNLGALLKIKIGEHIIKEISIKRTKEIGAEFAKRKNYGFLATAEDGTVLYIIIFIKDEDELDEIASEIRREPDVIDLEIIRFTDVIKGSEMLSINLP